MRRRSFLSVLCTAAAAGTAGCRTRGSTDDGRRTTSRTATPTPRPLRETLRERNATIRDLETEARTLRAEQVLYRYDRGLTLGTRGNSRFEGARTLFEQEKYDPATRFFGIAQVLYRAAAESFRSARDRAEEYGFETVATYCESAATAAARYRASARRYRSGADLYSQGEAGSGESLIEDARRKREQAESAAVEDLAALESELGVRLGE